MRGICHLALCLGLAAYNASSYAHRSDPRRIGEDVKVRVRVLYDDTVEQELSRHRIENKDTPEEVFQNIFQKVEQYFRNSAIMITAKVKNVRKDERFDVTFNDTGTTVDGPKTLKNLEAYAETRNVLNNTVYYLFTTRTIHRENKEADTHTELFDIETRDTFCTANRSAAVIRYHGDDTYDFAARAMALIFGSTRYANFRRTDRIYMKKTFARCRGIAST